MIDDMALASPGTVLHGDAHPGNSFFDADGFLDAGGSPGLYDWQTLSFGDWGHDVAYYIACGLHIWATNRVESQAEDICTAMTTRLGVAAEDYEFFRAWGYKSEDPQFDRNRQTALLNPLARTPQ